MKIVINRCYGGFTLSDEAQALLKANGWTHPTVLFNYSLRNDERLIAVVEELGDKASGSCSKLGIVEIPNDIEWDIEEYDGLEHVSERHRTWF